MSVLLIALGAAPRASGRAGAQATPGAYGRRGYGRGTYGAPRPAGYRTYLPQLHR